MNGDKPAAGSAQARERIIFIHGSLGGVPDVFAAQTLLAGRHEIIIPVRRGYGPEDVHVSEADHDGDAEDIAAIMLEGAHLVGTSTGANIAMMVAARSANRVCSLTLIEPPAFSVAADVPEVAAAIDALKAHWRRGEELDERAFMGGFLNALRMTRPVPDLISPSLSRAIAILRTESLWELRVPVEELVGMNIPTMVVSGGWSPVYDAVCARLAARLAAPLHRIPGHGHAVQTAGPAFNEILSRHIDGAAKRSSNMETEHATIG